MPIFVLYFRVTHVVGLHIYINLEYTHVHYELELRHVL